MSTVAKRERQTDIVRALKKRQRLLREVQSLNGIVASYLPRKIYDVVSSYQRFSRRYHLFGVPTEIILREVRAENSHFTAGDVMRALNGMEQNGTFRVVRHARTNDYFCVA